jgi:signal transduction histidine kinase
MDIAMISSENLQIRGEVFNVKLFLEELYNEMRRQYRDISKVIFTLSIPDNLLNIKIKTDRELIKKVFNHLIGNAFKFTKKGTIEFGTNIINTRARFYVKDSGIGIATDKIDEIFNPYVQEETDITRGYEGSGLGLAISKGIIERLGGNLWVESKKGIGSIFYFELPLTTE